MYRRGVVEPVEAEPEPLEWEADCFDVGLPHGGMWSRVAGGDELRCLAHDLASGKH